MGNKLIIGLDYGSKDKNFAVGTMNGEVIFIEEINMADYRTTDHIRTDLDITYTVFYDDYSGTMHEIEVIANDHECALKQVEAKPECFDVRLIFSGSVPKPIWIG